MDQIKTGKFVAQLRKQHDLTQEALGEKLGVTNKTVSRWENGNYMPDIEMLQLLSKELNVSINELLAGGFLSDEDFRKKADKNVISFSKASAFSFEERKAYFKKKWRKDHISLFVLLGIILLAVAVLPLVLGKPWLVAFVSLLAFVEYGYQNNKMMAYVEHCLYDCFALEDKKNIDKTGFVGDMSYETNSKTCFILGITSIVVSLIWFLWNRNVAVGIVWLSVGIIDLCIVITLHLRNKKDKR